MDERVVWALVAGLGALVWAAPGYSLQPPDQVRAAAEEQGLLPATLTVAAVGDVMMHELQVRAARGEDGRYRLEDVFAPVAHHIEGADLAFANLEAPLGGEDMAYSGYPTFNAPRALATALINGGFDVVQTANNHCMDRREKGLQRTLQALDAEGLLHVGTRADPDDPPALWLEASGIDVAMLAYTFSTNGIPLPPGREGVVSMMERDAMLEQIAAVREAGAELVIVAVHWGIEYRHEPEGETVELAHDLIEGGADLILGGHPHYLQPYEALTTADGREGFVIYSLGNFLSNMRQRYQDVGIVLLLTLEIGPDGGVALAEVRYVPTWVDTTDETGAVHHQVVDILEALPTCGHAPRLDAADCSRMEQALADTHLVLGEEGEYEPSPSEPFTAPHGGASSVDL